MSGSISVRLSECSFATVLLIERLFQRKEIRMITLILVCNQR